MKLTEVLREVPDPGPHPKVSWTIFNRAFDDLILKSLRYNSSNDKQTIEPIISHNLRVIGRYHFDSLDQIDNALHGDDFNELSDAIFRALIQVTHKIIIDAKSNSFLGTSWELKSVIDHTDSVPITYRELRNLIEAGCKGFMVWSEQKTKHDRYQMQLKYKKISSESEHLLQDLKHEITQHFDEAIDYKLKELKKNPRPFDLFSATSTGIVEFDVASFKTSKDLLAWIFSHADTPKKLQGVYQDFYYWVISHEEFGSTDPEVKTAALHAMWKDDEFKKKALKLLSPFFKEKLRKAAHG